MAITRAKSQQINIHSCDPRMLKDGLLKKYLTSTSQINPQVSENIPTQWKSIIQAVNDLGITTRMDYPVSGLILDLYLENGERALGVDLFGFSGHGNQVLKLDSVDTLIRAGVTIIAVSYYAWLRNPETVLAYIKSELNI